MSNIYHNYCRPFRSLLSTTVGTADAKNKDYLSRTQSSKVLPTKPGVDQYPISSMLISTPPPGLFTCIFPKPLLSSSCVRCD